MCLLPTASGDPQEGIASFHSTLTRHECRPSHVSLFRLERERVDLRRHLLAQDLIYVAGGSMLNLIAIWRAHGLGSHPRRGVGERCPAGGAERWSDVLVRAGDHGVVRRPRSSGAASGCCPAACPSTSGATSPARRPARGGRPRRSPRRLRAGRRRRAPVRGNAAGRGVRGDPPRARRARRPRGPASRRARAPPDPAVPGRAAGRPGDRGAPRAPAYAGGRALAIASPRIAGVTLPLKPPVQPQLALSRKALPEGENWAYEPKWTGSGPSRSVDGDDVFLQSRGAKPLRRYFPSSCSRSGEYILDGELVILGSDGTESSTRSKTGCIPPSRGCRCSPSRRRRSSVRSTSSPWVEAGAREPPARASCAREADRLVEGPGQRGAHTVHRGSRRGRAVAEGWEGNRQGADATYWPGERKGMVKVKRVRTADCVVVGWRPGKEEAPSAR